MKRRWMWALVLALIGVAVYAGTVLATPQSGVTTTIYAKSLFDQIKVKAKSVPANVWQARLKTKGQSDVYVVDNKLAPIDPKTGAVQGTTGWHSHPGPSLILVVAGTVTNYKGDDATCTGHSYGAGQGFIDSGSDMHILRNEGNVQAETIAVQFLPKDAPRRIDAPQAPGNCPF